MDPSTAGLAGRLRVICLAFPEVTEICRDAYRMIAPARLAARLER